MPMHSAPIRPEVRERMNEIARLIDGALPRGFGFVLLVFKFGRAGFMNYISNTERADVVRAMKEFVAKEEGVS
jgi:hypothetical protein